MAQIRIDRLRKEFGSFTAVQGSSFTIEDGEFFMLMQPWVFAFFTWSFVVTLTGTVMFMIVSKFRE